MVLTRTWQEGHCEQWCHMTYLQGECLYRQANKAEEEEEEDIQVGLLHGLNNHPSSVRRYRRSSRGRRILNVGRVHVLNDPFPCLAVRGVRRCWNDLHVSVIEGDVDAVGEH